MSRTRRITRLLVVAATLAAGAITVATGATTTAAAEPTVGGTSSAGPSGSAPSAAISVDRDVAAADGSGGDVAAPPAPYPYAQTFGLHSDTSSSKVIYLDFVGYTGTDERAEPYNIDGVVGFSHAEQDVIQEVWARVAETYSAFDVDVTTEDPWTSPRTTPLAYGVRIVFTAAGTGNLTDVALSSGSVLGVGYNNVFSIFGSAVAAVVATTGGRTDVQVLAETAAHEVGHNAGLQHDPSFPLTSVKDALMDCCYQAVPMHVFTQSPADAYAAMATNGLVARVDDHPDSQTLADLLTGPTFHATGVISTPTDQDWFSFTLPVGAGPLTITATPSIHAPMLDLALGLYDDSGVPLQIIHPVNAAVTGDVASGLDASITTGLTPGTYSLKVTGEDYGSIGTYTISGGYTVAAVACTPGTSSATGSAPCAAAPPGFFVDAVGATSATPCPKGSFADSSGSVSCTLAAIGSYVDTSAAVLPTLCSAGSFSSSVGSVSCTSAPPGSYVNGVGAGAATLCPAGSFSATAGSVSCTLAPLGSYVDSAGASAATLCPVGSYSSTSGSTACLAAPAGSYAQGPGATGSVPCAIGTYAAAARSSSCRASDPGSYVATIGATGQTPCLAGSFNPVVGASSCQLAPIGTYVGATGAASATLCPPGTTTTVVGSTSCTSGDSTPPTITPLISGGALGSNGWYTAGPVTVSWQVTDAQSTITSAPCVGGTVSANTAGTTFSCTATSSGGTATSSTTIKLDSVKPTVAYSGNAGTYGILSTVAISCTASDALSGLATNTCANIGGPAWTLGGGSHTATATASDKAGNASTATATYTVTVAPGDLCTLTLQQVQGSAAFQALKPITRLLINVVTTAACNLLTQITPKLTATQKTNLATQYGQLVDSLVGQAMLTPAQGTTLKALAGKI